MYICICKQITDKQIQEVICNGSATIAEIREKLGASSECGSCIDCLDEMITEYKVLASSIKKIQSAQSAS